MSMFRPRSSGISLTQLIGSLQGRGKHSEEGERQRFEHSQLLSAQKILTPIENQPKEKHVRNIIIGTFHEEGSYLFWTLMASGFQLETNHLVSWKFCYLFHRILRDGHKNVIFDSLPVTSYIQQLGVFWHSLSNYYGAMLEKYCVLLSTKLNFHDKHRFFPGNLQIEFKEFRLSIGDSVDAYFEISADVMDYLDCVLNLQHVVHTSIHQDGTFSHTAAGQCRLRPLVVCIQEANSLYDLLVKMLFEMHTVISPNDLEGHRTRFSKIYYRLREFYNMSSSYKFLKDLMVIPILTTQPNFTIKEDIHNYRSPVCCLTNNEEDTHATHNDMPRPSVPNIHQESYDYPISESWINRSPSYSIDNSYVGSVSYLPATSRTESVSTFDNQDLLSLEVPNDHSNMLVAAEAPSSRQSNVSPAVSVDTTNQEVEALKKTLLDKENVIRSLQTRILVLEAAHNSTITNDHKQLEQVNKKLISTEEKYDKMKILYANLRDKHVAVLQLVESQKAGMPQIAKTDIGMQTDEVPSYGEDQATIELNKELKERVRLLEDEKSKLQKETSDLSARAVSAENRLSESEMQMQTLNIQKAELEEKVKESQVDENMKKENETLSEKCKNLERQLEALNVHKTKLSDVLEMNRSNIAMIRETKLEMEANLVDAIHEKNNLEQRNHELQAEIEKQNHTISSIKAKFAELCERYSEMARDSRRILCDEIIAQCQSCVHRAQSHSAEDMLELVADCIRHCASLEATINSSDVMCIAPVVNLSSCVSYLMAYYCSASDEQNVPADDEDLLDLSTSVAELLLLAQYDSGERFRQLKLKVLAKLEGIFDETLAKCVPKEIQQSNREEFWKGVIEEIKALYDKVDCSEQSKTLCKDIEAYIETAKSLPVNIIASKHPDKLAEFEKNIRSSLKTLLAFLSAGDKRITDYSEFVEIRKALWSLESGIWLVTSPTKESEASSTLFDNLESVIKTGSSMFDRLNPLFKIGPF